MVSRSELEYMYVLPYMYSVANWKLSIYSHNSLSRGPINAQIPDSKCALACQSVYFFNGGGIYSRSKVVLNQSLLWLLISNIIETVVHN